MKTVARTSGGTSLLEMLQSGGLAQLASQAMYNRQALTTGQDREDDTRNLK